MYFAVCRYPVNVSSHSLSVNQMRAKPEPNALTSTPALCIELLYPRRHSYTSLCVAFTSPPPSRFHPKTPRMPASGPDSASVLMDLRGPWSGGLWDASGDAPL